MIDVETLDLSNSDNKQHCSSDCQKEEKSDITLDPLRNLLDKEEFTMLVRFVSALRMPSPYFGLVGALQYATQCLSRLGERKSFVRLRQFREAIATIADKLARHSELPSHLAEPPPTSNA